MTVLLGFLRWVYKSLYIRGKGLTQIYISFELDKKCPTAETLLLG